MIGDNVMVIAIVGALYWTTEAVKALINKKKAARYDTGRDTYYTQTDRETMTELSRQMRQLHEWHDKNDSDGMPLWYMPREWAKKQEEVLIAIRQLVTEISLLTAELRRSNGKNNARK